MNEEKDEEGSALDEVMVARIEIEGIGVAANEKEMTDSVTALPGVREVKIENGAMHVTYDPFDTTEKKIEEATTGFLFFPMENQKMKDLEVVYGGKENQIRMRFK